ncbi:hypothetical protein AJ85_19190 [Alkalihalobacillus alcalophilus ATCC 27647 = CGMCC 1.3604]|uniref:YetF C-terminal domain-containing protein n=1 Tax=Alkalihalobacillus alcalophilus ATCC 27647 = CGMCC 1.3604 TaxID=1218173 RepID=A0A094WR70_ALKAL|nr:DUF421 domain-containing protein [Alkalihalobacillus alcalophilus]KGA98558.1 hypothetical protein BALCAV_0203465 [Alkalihalobacillus alcalophilus ATCC 27647 = CGMCC 1.3604]MED1560399.1 DUF421 domain-containing protein [Alkalihalobacillus alcalophilus]THG89179.1 hypothetical protein AJ85_19190 [Alkalihalobacillus alcalophilus ATCC 27647 = CGMCC 1.3604]
MLIQELAIVLIRIFSIFPLLLVVTLVMGKRSIGELPIFDFLIVMSLASVTGADIADPSVPHIHTAFAIIVIALFQKFTARLLIKNRKFGKWITFEPTVVIQKGKLLAGNIESIRYSIDNILQLLRQKGIFDIEDVQLGIIEANGDISVQKKPEKATPALEDMDLQQKSSGISYPVILDGQFQLEIMEKLGITEERIRNYVEEKGIVRLEDVFLCTLNGKGELHLSYTREDNQIQLIQH